MDVEWFKIRSWHILRLTRSIEPIAICGKQGNRDAEWSNTLPVGKSCENCLRIHARRGDR